MRDSVSSVKADSVKPMWRREGGEHVDIGAGFAEGGDGLVGDLGEEVAVGAHDVFGFEEGGGGEDDVGVVGGVGEELLVDDGEEVVAAEAGEDACGVGRDGGGVAVVDEEGVDRGLQRPARSRASAGVMAAAGSC